MEFDKQLKEFPVVVYGALEKYNEVLSKGRCRIFYKGMNRNGTYITDEFAQKLLSTIPYAPVKGIYDNFGEDYTDHGRARNLGRIYGIVPENPNMTWELHEDADGQMREYACVDVLLFTGLYEEANDIIGKAQSMEIYESSIQGEWMTIEGQRAFVFTDGCFLGLQVLGEEVEPCFEGASFFSLYNSLEELVDKLETYTKNLNVPENNKGGKNMYSVNFKLSDDAKYEKLFAALNPDFTEENNWAISCMIQEVYEDYALVYNFEEGIYERVYYTKDEQAEEVTINTRKQCHIVDVTDDEKAALQTIQLLNGGTYEKINENFGLVAEFEEKISENEQKIEELNGSISTLEVEKEESVKEFEALKENVDELNVELNSLREYKLAVETREKEAVINKYAVKLNDEILEGYRENLGTYTKEQLDKELAYELVQRDASIFSLEEPETLIPQPEVKTGIEALLEKYVDR